MVRRDEFERKEKRHFLGYCDDMSKRKAERQRDAIIAQVNGQVYTLQSQIRFVDFIEIYKKDHLVPLAPGGRKRDESLLKNHIIPDIGGLPLFKVGAHEVQQFLTQKEEQELLVHAEGPEMGLLAGKESSNKSADRARSLSARGRFCRTINSSGC